MQRVIREIEIGSKLYQTVIRKVENNETISFHNGRDTSQIGVFKIIGAKAGLPGFVNIELERLDFEVGITK